MTTDAFEHVGEREHAVLQCIRDGNDDTRKIREATVIENHNVHHAFDKLEDLGLITTHTPDGRVTQIVDGEKRNFKAPRQATLTDSGQAYFAWTDREQTKYQDMTHDELVEQVHDLEQRIADLEAAFEAFRQQVLRKLE